ncbi:MAG: cytochrome c [Flavobacteriales bacterium]|nr:cytochrome c [Flavobacteriales bacterium]
MKSAALVGLALLAGLMACSASGGAKPDQDGRARDGEEIFKTECVMCHGQDGKLGMAGARDLTISKLSKEEMIAVVMNGKGAMIGFKGRLSAAQIDQVVDHVRTLHRNP